MIHESLKGKEDLIAKLRDKTKERGSHGRAELEKEWYRNILFYAGQQWIEFDYSNNRWKQAQNPPDYPDYPRPVTNKFARAVNTVKAVLLQKEPQVIVRPKNTSEEAIATFEIGDIVIDTVSEEAELSKTRKKGASWYLLTANVAFFQSYHLAKEYGQVFIPFDRCKLCGEVVAPDEVQGEKCPKCGAPDSMGLAIDGRGNQLGAFKPKGKLKSDPVSPFEVFIDNQIDDPLDLRQVVRSKRVDIETLKETYPDSADLIVADGDSSNDNSSLYLNALVNLGTFPSAGSGSTFGGGGKGGENRTAKEDYLWSLPDKDFPEGVVASLNGATVLEAVPLTEVSVDEDGIPFLPVVFLGLNHVPGSFWHRTFFSDLVPKQVQRNKLESFMEATIYTVLAGKWLEPEGANMDSPTGRPGQHLKFTHQPNTPPPQHIEGQELPTSLQWVFAMIDKDFEDIAATYDALKGQSPENVDTLGGLQLLTERAYSSHLEMITNWEKANERIILQLLHLARMHLIEERKTVMENEFGEWEMAAFSRADLQGGLTVEVEAGSSVPKSEAAERASILDSIKIGLIDITDQQVRKKILARFGQSELIGNVGEDFKDAGREWKEFVQSVRQTQGAGPFVVRSRQGIDNELVHYMDAVSRCKSPEFFDLPESARQFWELHVLYHKGILEKEAMRQAAMAAPVEKPAPGKKEGEPSSKAKESLVI